MSLDLLSKVKDEFLGVETGINEVVNNVQFGNRFRAMVNSPTSKKIFESSDSYFIKSFNIPNENISLEKRNTDGISFSIGSDRNYDTMTVTFYDREKGELRDKFLTWLDIVYDKDTGLTGYYNDYISNLSIDILPTASVSGTFNKLTFQEAFPSSVGDILYSRDSKNTLQEFTVTFTFKKLVHSKETDYGVNRTNLMNYKSN